MSWSEERFARIASQSQAAHGNKHVLPVGVVIAELRGTVHSAPEISRMLGAFIPPHRIHEALRRLEAMGALEELPYSGRPHARMFQQRAAPFWDFATAVRAAEGGKGRKVRRR